MPNIYSKILLSAQITLGEDDDFVFNQWTDDELRESRLGYGHAEYSVDFYIPNPEDEISPGLLKINNTDVYEGTFVVKKDGRTFLFEIDAKCKSNIHKGSKQIMDKGNIPVIEGFCINGQGIVLNDQVVQVSVNFSDKKI